MRQYKTHSPVRRLLSSVERLTQSGDQVSIIVLLAAVTSTPNHSVRFCAVTVFCSVVFYAAVCNTMLVVFLVSILTTCQGSRILALIPFPGRSHWIVMEPLFQELATRGHQVTVYSSFPQKTPLPNYTDFDLSAKLSPITNSYSIDLIKKKMPNPLFTTFFMRDIHEITCKFIQDPEFQDLLKFKDRYDLIITELFGTDCFAYFAYKLQIPLISYLTSVPLPWASERVGLPDNPSYIPNYLVNFSPKMNLWERLYNTLILVYAKFCHLVLFSKQHQVLSERAFNTSLPPIHEVVANTSLLFVNSYHALSQSRPFPPNVIEVGGIHIRKRKPLSKDLQDILYKSQNGVIVMSFGSLVRTSTLPKPIIMMFMKVFAKLPQTVIFKYEDDLPDIPSNVIIRKWLPQRDLLEHEKVIALIAHGGLASTVEAVYFGKPLIGIPFYADQPVNIMSVVRRGAGLQLDLDNLSEEKILTAVSEIVKNPKYTENMKQLSLQFRDRPMTPLDTAVYWTEYVIRHQGAPHLRPASVDLPYYQYLLLDVTAVLLVSITVSLYTLYIATKHILFIIKRTNHKILHKNSDVKKIE